MKHKLRSLATTVVAASFIVSGAAVMSAAIYANEVAITEQGQISREEVRRVFDYLDAQDIDGFGTLLADDIELRFGNGPSMNGKAAVAEGQTGFFAGISSMSHQIDHVWSKQDSFVVEGIVTYIRKDNSSVSLPFTDVFHMVGYKIDKLYVYIDLAPLFADS